MAIAEADREELGDRRGRNQYSEGLDNCPEADARDIAAKRAGFSSGKQYERAKTVTTHGAPELIAAMDSGRVAISTAAVLAAAPLQNNFKSGAAARAYL